ncbi:hypothetical protein ABFA07_016000 [Porites harrisoni]
MILIVSEIVPVKSAGDLEDESQASKRNAMNHWDKRNLRMPKCHVFQGQQAKCNWDKQNLKKFDSKRNAMYYWDKQNLKKFDSKRNAMYYWDKQNLKKFDSSSKEN